MFRRPTARITGTVTTAGIGVAQITNILPATPGAKIRLVWIQLSLSRTATGIVNIDVLYNSTLAFAALRTIWLSPAAPNFTFNWPFPGFHHTANNSTLDLRDIPTVAAQSYGYAIGYYTDAGA